jgi:hypothetical protein
VRFEKSTVTAPALEKAVADQESDEQLCPLQSQDSEFSSHLKGGFVMTASTPLLFGEVEAEVTSQEVANVSKTMWVNVGSRNPPEILGQRPGHVTLATGWLPN